MAVANLVVARRACSRTWEDGEFDELDASELDGLLLAMLNLYDADVARTTTPVVGLGTAADPRVAEQMVRLSTTDDDSVDHSMRGSGKRGQPLVRVDMFGGLLVPDVIL